MRKKEDCPLQERHLFCDEVLLEEGIKVCQQKTMKCYKSDSYKIFDVNKDFLGK